MSTVLAGPSVAILAALVSLKTVYPAQGSNGIKRLFGNRGKGGWRGNGKWRGKGEWRRERGVEGYEGFLQK